MTYEDYCLEQNSEASSIPCESCGFITAPFGLIQHEGLNGWVCGNCITDFERGRQNNIPDEVELWNGVRATRNKLLEQHSWTVALHSPLTKACQAEFMSYLKALHRITARYSSIEEVVWPDMPAYEYALT